MPGTNGFFELGGLSGGGIGGLGGGGSDPAGGGYESIADRLVRSVPQGQCYASAGIGAIAVAPGAADAEALAQMIAEFGPYAVLLLPFALAGDTQQQQAPTPIYRAVGPLELASIEDTRQFSILPGGLPEKQFWLNLSSAQTYGSMAISKGWDSSVTVVQTSVDQGTMSLGHPFSPDGLGPAVSFPQTALPKLNADAAKYGIHVIGKCGT